jgi:8-oxo-dGTP pyrophosphatase MutT (NUDIX family)
VAEARAVAGDGHDPGDELVDVVDVVDRVLGTVTRREMRAGRLRHRAVSVVVLHPDGRVLVHQRSRDKDLWPGWWDLAVGGVVGAGESYAEAARRELAEEVGVVDSVPELIGVGAYEDADVALIGRCYRAVTEGPFRFADGEVVAAEWALVADLTRLVGERPFVPDSRQMVLPLLLTP